MTEAFICDSIRTPFGKYGGSLSSVRTDDLAAIPIKHLLDNNPDCAIDDVFLGCANQAGEDNRNVARMAVLLAGLPAKVPGMTLNRLCGSGLDAVGTAARAIKSNEANVIIAGGVESMSRAPFVMSKSQSPFDRSPQMYDTTMGWRFINPKLDFSHGTESMIQTAENIASHWKISREEQDAYAYQSQFKANLASQRNIFDDEICKVRVSTKREETYHIVDEHPNPRSTLDMLAKLNPILKGGTVTAGNSSGINDGACAMLISNEASAMLYELTPRARIIGMSTTGVLPKFMGMGPVSAINKVLALTKLTLDQMDVIELNEAFAVQVLAVMKDLNLDPTDTRINANGGAIALGHPLGASGARLVSTAVNQLHRSKGKYALCSMCVGVGQGIAIIIQRV